MEALKLLVELGWDMNAQDKSGGTALHAAASTGKVEAVKVLVEVGADVHAQRSIRGAALHCC